MSSGLPSLLRFLLLLQPCTVLLLVQARPRWSWDVVPNYFHCANVSGEWNADALAIMATKPFVVFFYNFLKVLPTSSFEGMTIPKVSNTLVCFYKFFRRLFV